MADPATYRPAAGSIPTDPGVYTFRDAQDQVIYVGKAKNLRARLSNYFADLATLHPRTRTMVQTAASVRWTVVATEVEALQLEYTWIKKYDPRFNVRYRDDKTYPMLAVTLGERIPRAFVYRGPRRPKVRYFGPYSHAWAIRETVDLLTRVFPIRTCSKGVYNRHEQLGRPCLLGYIDKCAAPCIGRVSAVEHRLLVEQFCDFLAGKSDHLTQALQEQMQIAAADLDFEKAARLRDDIGALEKALERQAVVFTDGTEADFISFVTDELQAAVQIFHVRQGRIRGQRGWVVEKSGDTATAALPEGQPDPALPQLVGGFLTQFYGDALEAVQATSQEESAGGAQVRPQDVIPREILVGTLPEELTELTAWLTAQRGAKVDVRVPQRGDKRELMATVTKNAAEALRQHKLKRAGDLTARSAALEQLKEYLYLDEVPLRIECVDISHTQGEEAVASLVVFDDGLPKKAQYRRFIIREAASPGHSDDVGSIAEVTRRRFLRHRRDQDASEADDRAALGDEVAGGEAAAGDRRFAYAPQLYVVDGGAPQVQAAADVLSDLGITDVALIGIAKRLEEIWVPDSDLPVILPRGSEAMFLIQRLRDEAHRFAITHHRQRRDKKVRVSLLDEIPGIGAAKKTALLQAFGSVSRLKQARIDEIAAVAGFGPTTAKKIFDALHAGAGEGTELPHTEQT